MFSCTLQNVGMRDVLMVRKLSDSRGHDWQAGDLPRNERREVLHLEIKMESFIPERLF